MYRDVSSCNSYDYGDALYWDSRYIQDVGSFDWYQRYSALRPFIRHYIPISSRVLMVGCGNAVMSEDMVKDGYEEVMNIDISSVAIDMMKRKYENIPQLRYMQMDVRDMSFFQMSHLIAVDVFLLNLRLWLSTAILGTLDSLMCGKDAPISAARMLAEVCRLLKPGGIYMLITYGDPNVRMPHLRRSVYNWKIVLYIIPRPGFQRPPGTTSSIISSLEPVPLTEKGLLPSDFTLEDPDCHFIYVCSKAKEMSSYALVSEGGTSQKPYEPKIPYSLSLSEKTVVEMTQKPTLFKGQLKKKAIPPNRHGKTSQTRKGKRFVKPLKMTKEMDADRELSKFINYCNEVKAASVACKEGGQLSIIKPPNQSAVDASNNEKNDDK
ncbi:hypothetical protein Nepgr_032474 [Nepenthes gracilis]|uniref:Methyltransferase domain-containing protein n=1 Tax=Nepenthes gracilis TaxID=150966 RepID=A0AAD3Y8B4_NEPGR|nr:hypothetical protein Nepgr_032474 [Nepenthes gracilis]